MSGDGRGGPDTGAERAGQVARRRPAWRGVVGPVSAAAAVAVLVVAILAAVQLTAPSTPEAAPPAAGLAPSVAAAATPTGTASSATPSPLRPSASPTVRATTRPAAPPAAPPARKSAKKGVAVWSFPGASQALGQSKASWYYTWSTNHQGITTPAGANFVPMIWGRDNVTDSSLAQAKGAGPYLLGLEPPPVVGSTGSCPVRSRAATASTSSPCTGTAGTS